MSTFSINLESFAFKTQKLWPKKHINMQGVMQNITSVSCNHPLRHIQQGESELGLYNKGSHNRSGSIQQVC